MNRNEFEFEDLEPDQTYYTSDYVHNLQKRINNQRKQLRKQNDQITGKKSEINDLNASLSFSDAKCDMLADEIDNNNFDQQINESLRDENHTLRTRLYNARKTSSIAQRKLLAINHVIQRDDSDDAEADDLLDLLDDDDEDTIATVSIR